MSDPYTEDAPRQVPSLAYWAEQAQEELDKGLLLNIKGLHTVVCIDLSDSINGAAWEQAVQFFTDFIEGLKKVKENVDDEFVALTVFGKEVKVVQRLTNNYIDLQEAFKSLKLGGPTPLYGGLLMALAGVASVSTGVVNGIRIDSRVILVTDGHLTDPLLIAGSDVCDSDKKKKNQVTAMQAVQNISSRGIRIDCVPVGNADLKFLTLLATSAHGKVYSFKDGGKLARRTVNSCHAGHVLNLWKMMQKLGSSLGTEISIEDVMDISESDKIASLSQEEKKEVLEIAKEASKKASKEEDVFENLQHELEKYHYEFDDPAVQLPPLGTRVRRGPDWNRGREDDNGPGTIIGHHKNKRQVHVEWDKNGKSDVYSYGDYGKYDVTTVDEPRILQSTEKIATGCRVRRGKDWKWGNQDGTPGTNGVVIKVRDDGWVWVRWPDKNKNIYRFDTDGKFDLEICPVESQIAGVSTQPGHLSTPASRHEADVISFSSQASSETTEEGMVEQNEDNLDVNVPVSRVPKTSHWKQLAHKEIVEAQKENKPGIHTVICVDISASMRKRSAWKQTQQFFNDFINGLEKIKDEFDFKEDQVALSVFGQEVKVVQRLSKNYTPLKQAFSGLKLGGPTPMYGGLQMALAGLASPVKIGDSAQLHIGMPMDLEEEIESKMKHGRLTTDYSGMLKDFEELGKIAARQASRFSDLLMDLGVKSLSIPVVNGIKITPRIILITDGHLTDSLVVAGPDVRDSDAKAKTAVMKAVKDIAEKKVCIHCVPVGDADVQFLKLVANKAGGQIISFKDGRNLARRTINIFHAGHIIVQWKSMNEIGKSLGTEVSLEEVMDMPVVAQIASLSQEDKVQVLDTAKEAVKKGLVEEDEDGEQDKYHYEFDDPDVKLPPLGTRVCRGPDWDRGLQDGNGLGTITGHHKTKIQVHVEWDKDGKTDFYRYGDGKYDVRIVNEPRVLQLDELIATGCHVRRGKDWRWGNQGGKPNSVGVVIKVRDDDWVWVRWPDRSKNIYRFGADGCFDLEICDPSGNPFESQTAGVTTQTRQTSPLQHPGDPFMILSDLQTRLKKLVRKALKNVDIDSEEFFECDDPDIKLPSLGSRVRRGPDWNRAQDDDNGPGTIIGHHEDKRQVRVEWDKNGKCDFYRYDDQDKHDVMVVQEPRVLLSNEQIATGCHVKRGVDWKWGSQDGAPGAIGVVMHVQKDGCVWVRWPNKSKNIYRFGHGGHYDLEICDLAESQTAGVAEQLKLSSTSQSEPETADVSFHDSSQSSTMENLETADEKLAEFPLEIQQLDAESQETFRKALLVSKQKVFNLRVMIVGHHGVGKTTLAKRILGEDTKKASEIPTEGIETMYLKIDLDTKEWIVDKKESRIDDSTQYVVNIFHDLKNNWKDIKQEPERNFPIVKPVLMSLKATETQEISNIDKMETDDGLSAVAFNTLDNASNMPEKEGETSADSHEPETNGQVESRNTGSNLHQLNNTVNTDEARKYSLDIKKYEGLKPSEKNFAFVTLLDFAGQFIYYTTHQAFMSWRTLYLLVTNINRPWADSVRLDKISTDLKDNSSIADFVIYWMNSIYSHSLPPNPGCPQSEEEPKCPAVFLVATHMDEIPEDKRDRRKTEYKQNIDKVIMDRPLCNLVNDYVAISNFGPDTDTDIQALKNKIYHFAEKQTYWGEEIPASWFILQQKLMELKEPIINFTKMEELNHLTSLKPDELDLFLRFEHDLGNILFFRKGELKKKIIRDPKWLIQGVKILTSSTVSIGPDTPEMYKQFQEFKDTGRLTRSLLEHVWSKEKHLQSPENRQHLLGVLIELNIIAEPMKLKDEEKYYWVPYMIQKNAPDSVKNPERSDKRTMTSTLCFKSKTKFIHIGVFHCLVASCLSKKWTPVTEKNSEGNKVYHLYSDCCKLDVHKKNQKLLLSLNDFVIQVTVFRTTKNAVDPDASLCSEIKDIINQSLSDIIKCICPIMQFDISIMCENASESTVTEDNLHSFELLQTLRNENEEKECSCCGEIIKPEELLKFWEKQDDQQMSKGKSSEFQKDQGEMSHGDPPGPITQEHINHARLCIAMNIVFSRAMRGILVGNVPSGKKDIYEAIIDERDNLIKGNKTVKKLNESQRSLVFPDHPDPNSKRTGKVDEFDISLLYYLIRHVSSLKVFIGWGKDPDASVNQNNQPQRDVSLEASVERIRLCRNIIIGHSEDGKITQNELGDYWSKLKKILCDIENIVGQKVGYTKTLEECWSQRITPDEAVELRKQYKKLELIVSTADEHLQAGEELILAGEESIRAGRERIQAGKAALAAVPHVKL